jgi:hypothetical protein
VVLAELVINDILFCANKKIEVLHSIFKMLGSVDESVLPEVDKLHSDHNMDMPKFKAEGLENKFQNLGASGLDLLSASWIRI